MKITLIHPPQLVSLTNYLTCTAIPPLGLSYIASAARNAGHEVFVIDAVGEGLETFRNWQGSMHLRGLSFDEIVQRIPSDTELIGLGCMFSPQWPSTRELISHIRRRFAKVKIVIGGEHPSALPHLILKTSNVDAVVKGEGEETFVELVQALSQDKSLEGIPGLVSKNNNQKSFIPRNRLKDIDVVDWPAWDLFPVEKYIGYNQPHGASRGRSMPMLATRGCPYQCTFCSSPQMWTTRWYARKPNLVADEMEKYMKVYWANDFHFEDLTAIIKRQWIIDFSRVLVERGLQVTWQLPSGTRSEAIDEEVMEWMRKAGARNLSYAPESGSKRILKVIKKQVHLDHLLKAAKAAIRNKMILQVNIVLGFPEETLMDILKTYWFILRCGFIGFSEIHVACFYPLPHTEQYFNLQKKGVLPPDEALNDDYFYTLFRGTDPKRPISWNERFSDSQMKVIILLGYLLFFWALFLSRPWRLIRILTNVWNRKSELKTERILRGTLDKIFNLRKVFVLLLLSCFVLTTPSFAQQKGVICNQETLADCYEDAILLFNDKDYQAAEQLFEKVIAIDVGYKKAATYLVKCQNEIAKALIQEKTQAQRFAKAEKTQKQEIIPAQKQEEETNRIKTGDTLRISVQKIPELDKTVTVKPDGTFSFPLVGRVKASGKTLEELDQSLTQALSDYLKAPQVVVAPKQAQTELTSALPPAQ